MRLTNNVRTILVGVLTERERLLSLNWNKPGGPYQLGTMRLAISDAREGWIQNNAALWLGRSPTASESASLSRTMRRLNREGYVRFSAYKGSSRISQVGLTEAGEMLAKHLVQRLCEKVIV